jgi:hypothetical protein
MTLNGVVYENGASSSSSSGGMVGMVDCEVAEFEIVFVCKVGFRDEHDVNVVVTDECFQLVDMLCQAVGIPHSEAKEVRHYLSLVITVVRR